MDGSAYVLFNLTDRLPIMFRCDSVSVIFAAITLIIWVLCAYYSIGYFKKEKKTIRYGFFYLMTLIVLLCLDMAANLVTFYMFYELMTIMSVPLVFHDGTKEAITASLKYLFYSLCGAYMVLFGIYFIYCNAKTIEFCAAGVLEGNVTPENRTILLLAVFLMILGFSVKGGMLPMHSWLTSAHPVAPAPASAFLSGIIVKSGILGIIRTVYYIAGPNMIRNTYVQYAVLGLSIITVFLGSMLAYRDRLLKRRLAYSTVSQASYIIFGLLVMHPLAFVGAICHVVFHAIIKCGLFLYSGIVIHETGKKYTDELTGMGKRMPLVLWSFTFLSLSLIGIPPAAGFVSKWNLCIGALNEDIGAYSYLGPAVLLISALLTAGYLLPITIKGFLPGKDFDGEKEKIKVNPWMSIPLVILAVLSIVLGLFPSILTQYLNQLALTLM